jgi:2-polyprenyl-6-methoxyphenol hydroxylase-like FAD-dependent oxidoreductase
MSDQILVAGAGPTGLAAALWLAKSGARFRIIEKNAGPGLASRAMVVQARTLEFYRQLGIADDVVAAGLKMERVHLREGAREITTLNFGDFGKAISPYPFALSFPQDDHEKFLVEYLKKIGVEVEWQTELTGFEPTAAGVRATLKKGDKTETWEGAYLCGCDGARSLVREALGLKFPGGTYEQLFFVADVEASGPVADGGVNVCVGKRTLYIVFPLRRAGMYRLIGIVPPELSGREDVQYEDIRASVEQHIELKVSKVNWFSKYRVHHRVTDRFSVGRVFIAGDAAHVHSPAGGQGMNTGIGDAVNLAWKLSAVQGRRADPAILETYGAERIGFAHSLVATTDRLFEMMVGKGIAAEMFRTMLLPHIMPWLMGFSLTRKTQFRLISQTRIHYPDSPLSAGKAGHVAGGDRLPWVEEVRNFDALQSLQWQVHVYGQASAGARHFAEGHGLKLHLFAFTQACEDAGLKRDAFYLVRPDGYVAVAGETNASEAEEVLERFQIKTA